jgi:hypothetical protein
MKTTIIACAAAAALLAGCGDASAQARVGEPQPIAPRATAQTTLDAGIRMCNSMTTLSRTIVRLRDDGVPMSRLMAEIREPDPVMRRMLTSTVVNIYSNSLPMETVASVTYRVCMDEVRTRIRNAR